MKQYFIPLIALILLGVILCGCSSNITFPIDVPGVTEPETKAEQLPFVMEKIGETVDRTFVYYRNVATDVIYMRCREKLYNAGMGGLTVMLDPETGLPLTYSRYMELYNQNSANIE